MEKIQGRNFSGFVPKTGLSVGGPVVVEAVQRRERRFCPRVPCEVRDSEDHIIRNISQSGIYLESKRNYRPHEKVSLSLPLCTGLTPLQVIAEVVRRESLGSSRFGYGLGFRGLGADEYKEIQYFILRQMTGAERSPRPSDRKVFYKTIAIETELQNIARLDPRLEKFLRPTDNFYVHDLTADLQALVRTSGISDGALMAQILHTSATLCVNELDEPMLLMDLVQKLRQLAPKQGEYFHNSPMRQVNFCPEDIHCDQNGDAHVRAALFGNTTVSLIIRDGELVLGPWQKVALLEFDGPRKREVLVQVRGN